VASAINLPYQIPQNGRALTIRGGDVNGKALPEKQGNR